MTRALRAANAKNLELQVAVALALTGRGDARVGFKEWSAAERDYAEAVELLSTLQRDGAIQGTDVETLESARRELRRIRGQLSRASG
jgi:hypothetical protein